VSGRHRVWAVFYGHLWGIRGAVWRPPAQRLASRGR
jgi:hypothetical protein